MLNDRQKQIQKLVVIDKRTKWQSAVDKCDHRTGISHPWGLVKGLCGKQPHNSSNKAARFADKTYLDPNMIANNFAHQFSPPPIHMTGDKSKKKTAQTATASAAFNRNAVFHACRHKRSDPIGQIVHSHLTRRDKHPPPPDTRSRCH